MLTLILVRIVKLLTINDLRHTHLLVFATDLRLHVSYIAPTLSAFPFKYFDECAGHGMCVRSDAFATIECMDSTSAEGKPHRAGLRSAAAPHARIAIVSAVFISAYAPPAVAQSSPGMHHDSFEGAETTWIFRRAVATGDAPELLQHERTEKDAMHGSRSEYVRFAGSKRNQRIHLELDLPAARRIDDLRLRLSLRCSRAGPEIALRLVFPRSRNPETRGPLQTWIAGDSYAAVGEWQAVECAASERLTRQALQRLRSRYGLAEIDIREAYVDRAAIRCDLHPGETDLLIDGLHFGPVVPATETVRIADTGRRRVCGEWYQDPYYQRTQW